MRRNPPLALLVDWVVKVVELLVNVVEFLEDALEGTRLERRADEDHREGEPVDQDLNVVGHRGDEVSIGLLMMRL